MDAAQFEPTLSETCDNAHLGTHAIQMRLHGANGSQINSVVNRFDLNQNRFLDK